MENKKNINNSDRAELVVETVPSELRHSCYKELRYLSIVHSARGGWVIPPLVFYKYYNYYEIYKRTRSIQKFRIRKMVS